MQDDSRVSRELACRAAVLAGDESAWRVLYDTAYEPLRAFVYWRVGRQPAGVDEIVQETWLVAVRRIRDFNPRQAAFLDWMRGIAVNVLRNRLRDRHTANLPLQTTLDGPVLATAPENDGAERSARVAAALSALPEQYAAVLKAKYLEQRTVNDIAQAWNQTSKAIESMLTRARSAFREQFGEES